jgi:hypothetical protein
VTNDGYVRDSFLEMKKTAYSMKNKRLLLDNNTPVLIGQINDILHYIGKYIYYDAISA